MIKQLLIIILLEIAEANSVHQPGHASKLITGGSLFNCWVGFFSVVLYWGYIRRKNLSKE